MYKGEGGRVVNDPETDADAVQLGSRVRLPLRNFGQGGRERAVAIGREQKDRFDVRRSSAHQRQAVGLGPGVRLLVRADAAGLVAFGGDGGEDAAPREPFSRRQRELLREHVQHRLRVAPQHAGATPASQAFGRSAVPVVFRCAGRRFRQHDVHDILSGERRVPRPLGLIDDVIGRRDQRVEALDGGVPLTPEGRDEVRHELS